MARPGIYVSYSASPGITGYTIFKNRAMPKTKAAIDTIIKDIAETENVTHVIPLWIYPLEDVSQQ